MELEERILFGKELGIEDESSPLIQNEKYFLRRRELLKNIINIDDAIEAFYKSKTTVQKVNEEKQRVIKDCNTFLCMEQYDNRISGAGEIEAFKIQLGNTDIDNKTNEQAYFVEIRPANVIETSLAWLGINTKKIKSKNKYLDSLNWWPKEEELCQEAQTTVQMILNEITGEIQDALDSTMNYKQMYHYSKARVVYNVVPNFSAETLKNIINCINEDENLKNLKLEINPYIMLALAKDSNMVLKKGLLGEIEVKYDNQLELIACALHDLNLQEEESDLIFEVNKTWVKASRIPKYNWL